MVVLETNEKGIQKYDNQKFKNFSNSSERAEERTSESKPGPNKLPNLNHKDMGRHTGPVMTNPDVYP
jgi:hypothetical protein